jgi:poly-gamma-glutamate synthesis protein (capsule biosynthesis protein)
MKKVIAIMSVVVVGVGAYLLHLSTRPLPVYSADTQKPSLSVKENDVKPLLFVGDIMLGRYVETLQKQGLDPLGSTTPFLKSHITIANLEGPIPEVHQQTKNNTLTFSFSSTTPLYLKVHGISVVSLANNHALDQKRNGYEYTKRALDKEAISHFGGYGSDTSDYFETSLGTTTVIVFGINMISSMWNEKMILDTVLTLRQNHPQAYLITYIHWGNEYDVQQGDVQRVFAHTLIDSGVNAIIGSHPHVVQGVEVYKNAPIFYSLGNFIFDQYFSKETQEGYMLSMEKKNDTFIFNLIPVVSERSKVSIARDATSKSILSTIAENSSSPLKLTIEQGEIIVPVSK